MEKTALLGYISGDLHGMADILTTKHPNATNVNNCHFHLIRTQKSINKI